ncbi:MAG TPA: DUF1287 domain-containing protein [Chthoniobacterales bacterium]
MIQKEKKAWDIPNFSQYPLVRLTFIVLLLVAAHIGDALADSSQDQVTRLIAAARGQIGVTRYYDPTYTVIAYPGGDVPIERGVCTDVLIRAYREIGIDLQRLVHEDMEANFAKYPRLWGLSHPDTNIDHRRVPNLMVFFARKGQSLPVSRSASDYLPGDIVTWQLPGGVPHIGIVSDTLVDESRYQMIHNIGAGTQCEDCLFRFKVTGHYRYLVSQ